MTYHEGEVVVVQGEGGAGFFVILAGCASVSVDGRIRRALGVGDWFGDLSLVRDAPRSATVVAATDLRCAVLPVWNLRALVKEHASVATALGERMGRYLADDVASFGTAS